MDSQLTILPTERSVPPTEQSVPPMEQSVPPMEQSVPPMEQSVLNVSPMGQCVLLKEQLVSPMEHCLLLMEGENSLDSMFAEAIYRNIELATTPGLNLLAKCSNVECSSHRKDVGHICIGVGRAVSVQYKHVILAQPCPSCHQPIQLTSFRGILLLSCKAKVDICGEETEYVADQCPVGIWLSKGSPDVVITVLERTEPAISTGSIGIYQSSTATRSQFDSNEKSFTRACIGLNLEATCNNHACDATIVVIPCPKITESNYSSLLTGASCPGCQRAIPPIKFIGITLVKCKAEIRVGGEEHILTAEGDKTVDFKVNLQGPEVYVKILKRDISSSGELSGGRGKEYLSSTIGINIVMHCLNPECVAFTENDGQVILNCQDVSVGVVREVAKNRICPSCYMPLSLSTIKAVVFVRCSGQIHIGWQTESFNSTGRETSDFRVFSDGSDVSFAITDRSGPADSFSKSALGSTGKAYTTACDGLNFIAFCRNTNCQAYRENDGSVVVKRNEQFIERNGFQSTRCNYSIEIQKLACPSCENPLTANNVDGVGLVRCKGSIETRGKSENFIADTDDLVRHRSSKLDSSTVIVYKIDQTRAMMKALIPEKGLNLSAMCSNPSCPTQLLEGAVAIKIGEVTQCSLLLMVQARQCPQCNVTIPRDNYIMITFTQCTARVRNKDGSVSSFIVGEKVEGIPICLNQEPVIDILPVQVKEVFKEPFGSPYLQMKRGMNLKVICPKQDCASKDSAKKDGIIIISLQEMKIYTFTDLHSTVTCPFCQTMLSKMTLLTLSFIHCRAELSFRIGRFVIEAGRGEAIDFKPNSFTSDVIIHVMEKGSDTPLIFPDKEQERPTNKGSTFSRHSLCHGLNFTAHCSNPSCEADKSMSSMVMIKSGHLIDCDVRPAMQSLNCPFCDDKLYPNQVKQVTFLCCSGEITINGKLERFNATGQSTSDFDIPSDDSPIVLKVYQRDYHIIHTPALCFLRQRYTKHENGVNFHCYCKNMACRAVIEGNGLVVIPRDNKMVLKHGYNPYACCYSKEILQLFCISCGAHLNKYYVWA